MSTYGFSINSSRMADQAFVSGLRVFLHDRRFTGFGRFATGMAVIDSSFLFFSFHLILLPFLTDYDWGIILYKFLFLIRFILHFVQPLFCLFFQSDWSFCVYSLDSCCLDANIVRFAPGMPVFDSFLLFSFLFFSDCGSSFLYVVIGFWLWSFCFLYDSSRLICLVWNHENFPWFKSLSLSSLILITDEHLHSGSCCLYSDLFLFFDYHFFFLLY